MNSKEFFIGILLGIIASCIGSYLFITLVVQTEFWTGLEYMKSQHAMGKIITLGAVFNLIVFGILLKFDKEIMARGVVLATILLSIITLFI
ncbi:hypothetical protein B0A58_06245 [Flavobacterium branchiophilum NBRC 15030 = ATCC 35035]|uniref:Uncharacterized protein n=2 Tax=Flavobacterium branchiophilum TaxID=55197 RepID=G2Z2T3_FLABF|nr:hypothetical protein [Flavobacterium branchiophilum]OXA77024.1 hypothetical protein B0A58_06245 [Flavobacterium branchiophilum NBRC 15030 = ATCC 35035]PDS23715.1 hypothetical protein B0A77_10055 [Flavobacterium branchiophilum]TQM39531.1 hypothetical protein BC670_0331 [Flavobacterium branchiophilum]CCB70262.1 Probable transmembrane protein of unknown function [Flavobacterium branchiophilum FL-15]GEM54058.1 hypothetical protein FB1_02790 [Flavobacterium branchiophilum NBRC 15030 = ATCC 35035